MIVKRTKTENIIDSLRQARQVNCLLRDELRHTSKELKAAINQAVEVAAQVRAHQGIPAYAKRKKPGPSV